MKIRIYLNFYMYDDKNRANIKTQKWCETSNTNIISQNTNKFIYIRIFAFKPNHITS